MAASADGTQAQETRWAFVLFIALRLFSLIAVYGVVHSSGLRSTGPQHFGIQSPGVNEAWRNVFEV